MANGQTVSGAPADVVVAADADRLGEYEDALRKARVATRATLDADEAETLVAGLNPDVLVLDRGLPRLILFRLYGLVREDASETPIQVVFVAQEGDTGPGDHYLPGDPSPSNVADRVTLLLASASAAAAATPAAESPTERGAAGPADQPETPTRPDTQTAVAGGPRGCPCHPDPAPDREPEARRLPRRFRPARPGRRQPALSPLRRRRAASSARFACLRRIS